VAVGSGVLIARVAVACVVTVGATRVAVGWHAMTNNARPIMIQILRGHMLRSDVIVTLFCD
jgi:hypothetical protein